MIDIGKLKYKEAMHDKCGVFGIYAKGLDVAKITYFALHSLQHRGQESAGIVTSDGVTMRSIKRLGLVTSVFNETNLKSLHGYIAVGHNRYSTTGGNTENNIQPVIIPGNGHSLTVAHNGNLTNAEKLASELNGHKRTSTSDTELLALLIAKEKARSWEEKIVAAVKKCEGAYSIVCASKDKLFAFRDPWGFRPLTIGKLHGHFVVASESCALDTIGATVVRDVLPGEIVVIQEKQIRTVAQLPVTSRHFCLFEYVYLARPDSVLNSRLVHQSRQTAGELLAKEAPVDADMVVAVPDSGTSAAIGFAKASNIPYGEVLIKNRYIGRTFISPDQSMREQSVKLKFNPMKSIVAGKRIVLVDDSIVRGTTMRKIVDALRLSGAKKIHLRICSPPVKWPCFFGVDTPTRKELIASTKSVAQIKNYIKADTLHYLSLSGLIEASKQNPDTLCTACFTGKYPVAVDMNFSKTMFEKSS